jgi:hypothetical protein
MLPRSSAQVEVQFPAGERYAYGIVPYRQIDFGLPSRPGLYSWHFRIPKTDPQAAAAFLQRLFVSSTIDVTATSNMRQSWSGILQNKAEPFRDIDSPLLHEFFFALAYPLYVGISRDLASRLKTHKKELDTWRVAEARNFSLLDDQSIRSDTAEVLSR